MNKFALPGIFLALLLGLGVWVYFKKPSLKDFELDPEKQQFIWDAEHVTFEIENYFGKPFATALCAGDDEALGNLVRDDFLAETLPLDGFRSEQVGSFQVQRWEESDDLEQGDVSVLIAFFKERLKSFQKIERSRVRVLKIDSRLGSPPAERDGEENRPQAWDTELLITVHGISMEGYASKLTSHHHVGFEYAEDEEIHNGQAAVDWKTVDCVLTQSSRSLFREKTGELKLQDFAIPDNWRLPSGKAQQFQFQVAVEDFDRDGDFDLAVSTYDGIPFLLCMEDGQYINRSREMGLSNWAPEGPGKTALAGWVDFDNDGYPDLLMGTSLYRNVGGLRFKNVTAESGFEGGFDPHGVTVADFDCDGRLDLYISRSHEFQQKVDRAGWVGDEEGGAANTLWHNEGNGKFRDVTDEANAGGGNRTTFSSSWFFYDDDHFPDLYLVNDFASNVVLRNRGDGTFEDVSDTSGAADFATSMGLATGDLDNDGTTEIYVANMYSKMGRRIISHVSDEDYPEGIYPQIRGSCAGNRLYRKGADGRYSDVTEIAGVNEVGWAFAPLMCDFDGDGLLDIYATTGFMSFDRQKPDG